MPSLTIAESIPIDAPPDVVWQRFADIASWPRWNPTCRRAAFVTGEPWTPGSRFAMTMTVGPVPLSAVVEVVETAPGRSIVWTGGRFGVRSRHEWALTPSPDNGALLESRETFTGWTLPLLRLGGLQPLVNYLSRAWLHGLKRAAERQAPH